VTSVLGLVALLFPGPWTREEPLRKLSTTLPVITGFIAGCLLGAAGVSRLGVGAWSLPALLSLLAFAVGARVQPSTLSAAGPRSGAGPGDAPGDAPV
jgi:hypothetical protein